jgi:hypothetical protein
MTVFAIDPGPVESAYCAFDGTIRKFDKLPNAFLMELLTENWVDLQSPNVMAIEVISSYGARVGSETFATCEWIGRFTQLVHGLAVPVRVKRSEVCQHVCDNPKAGDKFVREALIDRFGEPGTKKEPGPTYGITKDCWAALAIAVTVWDRIQKEQGA